jgi:ABC-type proline/glycine betaine transport system substrate-binding protein
MQSYKDAERNIGVAITKKKKSIKEDHVEKLESGLNKLQKTDYDSINKLMMKIAKDENITGKDLHNDFVKKHGKIPDNWIKDKKQEK